MKSLRWRTPGKKKAKGEIVTEKFTLPASLEDGRVPVFFDRFSYFASALILAFLLWGSLAEIREFASASGRVVPSTFVKLVHHLEGGQVESVKVREGQIVEKGQALVALRPVAASSDLGQLQVRKRYLGLKKRRLEALIDNKELAFDDAGPQSLEATESGLFSTERNRLDKELRTLEARILQRKIEVEALAGELASLKRQVEISSEQLKMRARLLKDGYTSRRAYLESQSELERARAQVISTRGRLGAAKQQLAEAKNEYEHAKSNAANKYSEEHSQVASELAELDQSILKHQDRVDRLKISAPVRGVVQELTHKATGEVVRPGDLVAKIVPIEEDVVAEVNVEPKDIGHINVGDEAEITISTFDPNVYGILKGKVQHLSATTFQTSADSAPYFKAIVKLEKGHFGTKEHPVSILPGMEVQANIVTGAKSLVRYFLKPVYRSLNGAFSER